MTGAGGLTHDQLAEDLARHLAAYSVPMVVWTDMQLGPSGSARPDVYAIEKTYTAVRARVFEVKVTRSDFLSDVTSGKYLRYGAFAGSITFATPAGLVSKEEVPKGCGLITRSADGVWRYQRKPTLQPTPPLSQDAWLKLVIDGCARERENARLSKTCPRSHSDWMHQRRAREKAGDELALALANRDQALRQLGESTEAYAAARKKREADELASIREEKERIEAARAEAAQSLGLSPDSGWWTIRNELDARMKDADRRRIEGAMRSLSMTMDRMAEQRAELARLLPLSEPELAPEGVFGG